MRFLAIPVCLLAVLGLANGCGKDDDKGTTEPSSPTELLDVDQLADVLDCTEIADGDSMIGPLRSGAATRGVSCDAGGFRVHVFERAPVPEATSADPEGGGSIANIKRITGVGSDVPECETYLLITKSFFVVANDSAAFEQLPRSIGEPVEPTMPAAPTISYLPPPDCKVY